MRDSNKGEVRHAVCFKLKSAGNPEILLNPATDILHQQTYIYKKDVGHSEVFCLIIVLQLRTTAYK
jgi:hypothetical protein